MTSSSSPDEPHGGAGFLQRLGAAILFPFRLPGRLRELREAFARQAAQLDTMQTQLGGRLDDHERRLDQDLSRFDRAEDTLRTHQAEINGAREHLDTQARRHDAAEAAQRNLQAGVEELRAVRDLLQKRSDAIEATQKVVQLELETLRDRRTVAAEGRLDSLETSARGADADLARLRDQVIPAVAARGDVLLERLAVELDEVGSLVERMLLKEPLPAPSMAEQERLSGALAAVAPLLLASFRGSEEEIRHRLDHHLRTVKGSAPVLDLGSGRGELLLLLREAGVEATGVEEDPALVQTCLRRGLKVVQGDVLAFLNQQAPGSWGAVTAFHLLEHLSPAVLLGVLAQVRRSLRPGGVLLAECPNPHTVRVGASLYWRDPTHQRPLLPETLELFLAASGFTRVETELLHPFPTEQMLAAGAKPLPTEPARGVVELKAEVDRLREQLDQLLNGPRDFAIRAYAPANS